MPMSAARSITEGSEVVMQPKESDVTLSPVLPSVRYVSFTGAAAADAAAARCRESSGRQSQPGSQEATS